MGSSRWRVMAPSPLLWPLPTGERQESFPANPDMNGRYLREWAGKVIDGDSVVAAKVLVVLFFCSCGVAQSIFGPSFNPFKPAHDVVYRVTGLPPPASVTAPAPAAQEKPKED